MIWFETLEGCVDMFPREEAAILPCKHGAQAVGVNGQETSQCLDRAQSGFIAVEVDGYAIFERVGFGRLYGKGRIIIETLCLKEDSRYINRS